MDHGEVELAGAHTLAGGELGRVREPERVHGRSDEPAERDRARGVVRVVVRDEHRADRSGLRRDVREMLGDVGTRIDHERRIAPDDPRVRPLQCVDAGVRGEHPSDREQGGDHRSW
jgi:hypothetical protein